MISRRIFTREARAGRYQKRNRKLGNPISADFELLECRVLLAAADSGEWGQVIDWGLQAKHMVALPTGDVLVWATGVSASVWDSATNTLHPVPFNFGDLHCAAQVTLADGRVAVFGGVDGEPHVGIEITAFFDPFTNTWTEGTVMNFERWYATATTLADGRVLVTSGDDHDEARVTIPEIYDPVTDSWTLLTGADRSQVLYPEMFVLPDGRIYEAGTKEDTWFLNINGTGSWTVGPENSFGSSGYAESAVMYEPGKILRVGGGDPAFANAAIIDTTIANAQWEDVESMEFERRRLNLTILADGSVMAIGGTGQADDASQAVLEGEIWDPETEQWTTVAAMTEARMYHSSSVLLADGRVLTGGGESTGRLHAQIYSPPYLFQGPRPTISSSPTTAAFGSQFTIESPQAAEITSVSLIRPGAATHAFDHNQRYVPLSFTRVGSSLQVTAPPDGNTAPPGYYMLVVENGSGVPSVASWIQINSTNNLAPGTIAGRVTNSVTGAGIAGATVSTTFGSVTTNSTGNYTLPAVPSGEHVVTVSAPGFATYSQSQQVLPNQTSTLNFGLVVPGQVTGVVRSQATGLPIPGAKISYNGGSIFAGADGSFVASGIPSGVQTIVASKLGFQNVQQNVTVPANGSVSLNFSLPTALTAIEGEVRDAITGDPIEGALVMYGSEMTVTNASGFYIFRDVPPGEYHVTVTAANYVGEEQHAMVESGFYTTADFNLLRQPVSTVTIAPTDDALVKTSNMTKNYGQLDHIRLRAGTDTYQSYLKFNVSGLASPINKATLRLWSTDGSNSTASVYLVSNNLNGTSNAWTENNINWNNAPPITGTPLSSVVGTGTGVWVEFDVTAAITGNGVFSLGMLNSTSNSVYFSSTEGTTPPQLVIETFAEHHDGPMIHELHPSSGNIGAVVSIHGMNFSGVTSVHFNGVASTQVAYVSDTEVRALVPVGATTGKVTVTTAEGVAVSEENFTVQSNSPVIVTAQSWLPYTENAAPIAVEPNVTVTDSDSPNLVSASASIVQGFASGQDVLSFTTQSGIIGSYNATTGVLTFTGVSSVSNYQALLRSVKYANTSHTPSTTNRIISFTVNDGSQSYSAGRIVTVTAVNDLPVANNESYTIARSGTLTANDANGTVTGTNNNGVLVNDTDAEGSALNAAVVTLPVNGSLSLNANGTFTYVHNGGTSTSDSFTYRVNDGTANGNVATVSITVTGTTPTGPTTNADSYTVAEGATLNANDANGSVGGANDNSLLVNDVTSGTGTLTATIVTQPSFGTLTLNANGTFTYIHNGSENLADSFTYRSQDGGGPGNVATVTITVSPVNDQPVANNDSYTVTRGGTLTANDANGTIAGTNNNGVLVNDTDAEGNALNATIITQPANGTLTFNVNGTFTYVHNGGTSTSDSFVYRVNDGSVNGGLATVNITVTATPPTTVTANFQDGSGGYTGTSDAYIRGNATTTNDGSTTTFELDGYPDKAALIRWNLTGIPTGSTISAASIRIFVTDTSTDTFEIYGLNRAFIESQVTYQRAATGVNWSTAGAQGAADRGSTVLGVVTAPTAGLVTINLNAAGVALVQQWLNNPSSNFGLIFQDYNDVATNGLDFASSETGTVANRPRLTVTYSTPALMAATEAGADANGTVLTQSDLATVQKAAAQRLIDATSVEDRSATAAALARVQLSIASLPSGMLGTARGNTIFLDADAAGFGWYIDATPGDDLEFVRSGVSSDLTTNARSMDLLTVVMHEMEHVLGDGHSDDGLMEESLTAGTRRLPTGTVSDAPLVDALFAELVTSRGSIL